MKKQEFTFVMIIDVAFRGIESKNITKYPSPIVKPGYISNVTGRCSAV